MTSEKWEETKRLFDKALDLAPESRQAFLVQEATDPDVLNEVVRLLHEDDRVRSGFLEPSESAPAGLLGRAARLVAANFDSIATPGLALGGRYEIVRELGSGGVGVVFLARDRVLHSRPVVVKFLLPGGMNDERIARKFQKEIEALARIRHPGVVGALDAGTDDNGRVFLVMEYVEGSTMRNMVGQPIDMALAANLITQIAAALSAAHAVGVLHRDLKPENVMLQGGTVKLIDFGVAKLEDPSVARTLTSAIIGTVDYMAPEQLMGQTSIATDVFSLGVIAYELLTGVRPFDPKTPFALYELQRRERIARPSKLRPGSPRALDRVILRALSFDAAKRPASAREFSEEFGAASREGPSARAWVGAAIAAVALMVGAGGSWLYQTWHSEGPPLEAIVPSPPPVTEDALSLKLNLPIGLARDSAGNVYISDYANHVIRKVMPDGRASVIAGMGVAGYSGSGGPAALAQLNFPRAMALFKDRYLYVSEPLIFRVRRIDLRTGIITLVLGDGLARFSGDGMPGPLTSVAEVLGLAVDAQGNLLVADTGNQTIRKVSVVDGRVTTIAGTGSIGWAKDNTLAVSGHLNRPAALAVAPNGDLYVSDVANYIIQRIRSGIIARVAGDPWTKNILGPAPSVLIHSCTGMIVKADGSGLYFSDETTQTVRFLDFATQEVSLVAGNGKRGFSGDSGDPKRASLGNPNQLVLLGSGLLMADALNNRIRRVIPGQKIETFAGIGQK